MNKNRIVFDVDGVIVNFLQHISEFITEKHGLVRLKEYCHKQYNLSERFEGGIYQEAFNQFKLDFENEGKWKNLPVMPNSDLANQIINNKKIETFFVTALPIHLFEDRLINLNEIFSNKIDKEQLFCVPLGKSKKPYIDALSPSVFIEDNLHNAEECQKDEMKTIWIDLNEDYYDLKKYNNKIARIHNLNDSKGIIEEKLELTISSLKPKLI